MATPLLKYLIVSPSSGAVSSIVDTSAGTALNLTCTSVTGTSITAGVGATFGSSSGAVSGALNGTKVATALAGGTVATWEFVADTTSDSGFMELVGLQATSFDDVFSCVTGSAGTGVVGFAAGGAAAWFNVTPGRHHFLAVFNSTLATAADRLRLYVDGVLVTSIASSPSTSYPALNAAIDVGFTNYANLRVTMGCLVIASVQPFIGDDFGALMYASALTSGDATAHSAAMLANNDADPNVATGNTLTVASTVPGPTMSAALASTNSAAIASTVGGPTMAAALASTNAATIASTLTGPTMAATLLASNVVALASAVSAPTMVASLASTDTLAVASTLAGPTMAATVTSTNSLAIAATVPGPTMAAALIAGSFDDMVIASTVGGPTMAAALASTDTIAVAAAMPGPSMVAQLAADEVMGIVSTLAGPTMSASLFTAVPPVVNTRPDVSGFFKRVYV